MIMLRRIALAALALAVVGMLSPARAQAPSGLRWKFKEGQTLRYLLTQNTNSSISVGGQSIDNTTEQAFEVTWKVKSVKSDGSAEMTQVFDRAKMAMDTVLGQFTVDTNDEKDPEGPGAALGQIFRALVGGEATMVMSPLGEIKDFKLPAKAAEALKNVPQMPGSGRMLSEESFKGIVEQATLVLPGKTLRVDESWNSKREQPQPPVGTILIDTTYTFKGPDEKNKALDKIDLKSTLDLKVNPDFPVVVKINKQDVKGTVLFDREGGFLKSSKVDQKLDLGMEAMGQNIDSETKNTVAITLRDGSDTKQ
jgi:hypothetical protein